MPPETEPPNGNGERITFCRICEAHCGLVATVEDGKVTKLRPDPEHPLSQGYACPKGIAMTEVQNDPDRVLHPLRRRADGDGFERVSWDDALSDIASRLNRVREAHGNDSVGMYFGNPGAISYSHTLWSKAFMDGLGSPHYYTAGSQDVNNRFAASALLYGSPLLLPIPDIARTRFLLMVGANPMVSNGSLISVPRVRDHLRAITNRGGRIVVVDPRRTETAREFEHLPVVPDSDAWLLLSMLQVVFADGLADRVFLHEHCDGAEQLEELAREHTPESTAKCTGVPAERLREIARDFARADGAAAYGRTGSCLGHFGTLVAFLLDSLNAVTGNIDRPGGWLFASPPVEVDKIAERFGLGTYGKRRSRFGGFPDVLGNLPAALMGREITTPGRGQIRALIVTAGNPVLSVPDGESLGRALGELELMVSLDLYVTETNRHADYILPATTWLERDDVPLAFLPLFFKPFIQHTDPVVSPAGEAREESEVLSELARRMGFVPSSVRAMRLLGRVGLRPTAQQLLSLVIRTGPGGDWYGLRRGGLNMDRLRAHPHGMVLAEEIPTGDLKKKVRHRGGRIPLTPPAIVAEIARLKERNGADPAFPMRLIGMRELRSHNSWMHNAPMLMRGNRRHALRIHPDDAVAAGLADGAPARVESKSGAVEVPVVVTDEMTPGTVALPHGWGHRGGWRLANEHAGVNVNVLASSDPDDLERLAGMSVLNGIPVRVEPALAREEKSDASDLLAAQRQFELLEG